MKVNTTDNLAKTLGNSKGYLGELKVPVIGLKMGLPIGFKAKTEKVVDAIDEESMLAEAEKRLNEVMSNLAQEVEAALTEALKSSVWSWKGGARDIYDTGELARSVKVAVVDGGISVSYGASYANIVHNGGYIQPYGNTSARPIYLPPRPWISSVLYGDGPVAQFDFDDFLKRNL
jgi:hypothetical protein